MKTTDITIIGAGVVGLAIAAELSKEFKNIVVLERNPTFGQEISSRNSEVIHSGIYYPQGSLKAELCVKGAELLYEICNTYSIPYKITGKLIIATEEAELDDLKELFKKGKKNNVKGIEILEKNDIQRLEPNTNALAAIYSPNTGIIDSHLLMKYFFNAAKERGVLFAFASDCVALEKVKTGFKVSISQDNYCFDSRIVINCAGISSDKVASMAGIDIEKEKYKLKLCKGTYFSYAKNSPVKRLVYPLPHKELTGLGVHATLNLANRLRFGPDVEYVDAVDYNVDSAKKDAFYEGANKIIPGLQKDAFIPDQAGVRPKLYSENEPVRDFIIKEETDKALAGLINLIGIESPGLTASGAIAGFVKDMVLKN